MTKSLVILYQSRLLIGKPVIPISLMRSLEQAINSSPCSRENSAHRLAKDEFENSLTSDPATKNPMAGLKIVDQLLRT